MTTEPLNPMQQALELAAHALFISNPNPRVGCVIMSADGATVLGSGFTQQAGGPHAEVMALRDAAAKNNDVRGATAYVTLEPCSHHGRTGPCCDALIAAGIGRVEGAILDPNPRVAGQGFDRLRAAGVTVNIGQGGAQSRELNIGFFSRMIRKQPWVRLKAGTSLDGGTALQNGQSQWITSEAARADGHAWRARACAILTGIGTVLADDPLLNVRGNIDTPRQPRLVIVDSQLRTPVDAKLFSVPREVLIYCVNAAAPERRAALEARGATVISLPAADGRIDLRAMLLDLGSREVNELHVEAGGTLNGALVRAGVVDEVLVYMAPKILGAAQSAFSGMCLTQLADAAELSFKEVVHVGDDLRIRAVVKLRENF